MEPPKKAPAPRANSEERLFRAAVSLFAERTYSGTTTSEVAARAGVTKGALFHHFPAKDDLLFEVYHRVIVASLARLRPLSQAQMDPVEKARRLIDIAVDDATRNRQEVMIFAREMHMLSTLKLEPIRRLRDEVEQCYRSILREGVDSGAYVADLDVNLTVRCLIGIVQHLAGWYRPDGALSPAQIADQVARMVLDGIVVAHGAEAAAGRDAGAGRTTVE